MHNYADIGAVGVLAVPAAQTSTFNGPALDVRQRDGQIACILNSAAGTGTTPTLDGKIQESADGSTDWQDVPGATFAQVTGAAASVQRIGVNSRATRGYIRFVGTIAGGTPSFTMSAAALAPQKYPS